jgi:hypothetical protein
MCNRIKIGWVLDANDPSFLIWENSQTSSTTVNYVPMTSYTKQNSATTSTLNRLFFHDFPSTSICEGCLHLGHPSALQSGLQSISCMDGNTIQVVLFGFLRGRGEEVGAGVEIRALHLLGRHSTTWATPPAPFVSGFQIGSCFCLGPASNLNPPTSVSY